MNKERRQHSRIDTDLSLTCLIGDQVVESQLHNLCEGGCLVTLLDADLSTIQFGHFGICSIKLHHQHFEFPIYISRKVGTKVVLRFNQLSKLQSEQLKDFIRTLTNTEISYSLAQ